MSTVTQDEQRLIAERERIALECEEAANKVENEYPIAARVLRYEAAGWRAKNWGDDNGT